MSVTPLDLQQLALDQSSRVPTTNSRRPRRYVSRYVIPAAILLGFLAVFGVSMGRQLLPRKKVTVMPVIAKRGAAMSSGSVLFQAAGWVEPRPRAVKVTALAGGIVEDLLVVEGQELQKGEPVARLLSRDAELQVEHAQAAVEIADGEVQRAAGDQKAAQARLQNPTHRQAELADAESQLARARAELARLPALIQAAEAQETFARLSLESKMTAGTAVSGIVLEQTRRDSTTARADVAELQSRQPHLEKEVASLQSRSEALAEQLRLLIDEQRSLDEATARLSSAEATRRQARVQLQRAQLNLERTTIRAPLSGRVLTLVANVGSRVIGLEETTGQNSAVIIEMYDPDRLQIRADVRLEDVPMVMSGAPVEIETASFGKKLQGRVLRPTSSANVQKNTLEVKIELMNPPAMVTPEMLVKATFLAPASLQTDELTETERLYVPRLLIQSAADDSLLWILAPDGTAVRKLIRTGSETDDGLVEVVEGLLITDKLIASGTETLRTGEALEVQGEDQLLGIRR